MSSNSSDVDCDAIIAMKPWTWSNYTASEDPCNSYDYIPSKPLGIAFLSLFSILTAIQLLQLVISRRWWLISIMCGCICEVLGWAARVVNSSNPDQDDMFTIQITVLIIGPCFFSAALYAYLGWVIKAVGPQYSILKPKRYLLVFISADVISIVIQAAGGGIASGSNTQSGSNVGGNIMEAGIAFQLVTTLIFFVLGVQFSRKTIQAGAFPERYSRLWWGMVGIWSGTSCIVLRGIYRTVELAQGWNGYTIEHELYILLDSIPMVLCLFFIALFHPHWTVPKSSLYGSSSSRPFLPMVRTSESSFNSRAVEMEKPTTNRV